MPEYNDPVARNALKELTNRIGRLEREVAGRRKGGVIMSRLPHDDIPNPYEGQAVIDNADGMPYYYGDGEWHPFGSAGAANVSATGLAYMRSLSCPGILELQFDEIWRNDASFGYAVVASSRAKYITISKEGWYLADFSVFWDTDWTVGDFPYIEPSDYVGGFAGTLVNDVEIGWDDTQFWIGGEQFTAAEMDHHNLTARMVFNFTTSYFGFASIGIGVNMRSGSTRTKNFGGRIQLTWLGDPLTQVTIT